MTAVWIKPQDAAAILDMPVRTVTNLAVNGDLPARKFGRLWRIHAPSLTQLNPTSANGEHTNV